MANRAVGLNRTGTGSWNAMAGPAPEEIVRRAMLRQRWRDVSFLHWPFDPPVVQALLPAAMRVDTFDGAAWVSLTPFSAEATRPLGVPPAPGLSWFPETNLRTYVIGPDGRDGLWFFTLEADSLATVVPARGLLGVPYRWAAMSVERQHQPQQRTYRSRRRLGTRHVSHRIVVRPTALTSTGDALSGWLTGRWRAWTRIAGRFATVPAQHEPWPLNSAELVELDENLMAASGLRRPDEPPTVHFSPGVDVRLGWPQPVTRPDAHERQSS